MKKKAYEKPTCKVFELKHRTMLLAGSYPGEVYVPGIGGDDEKKLA